MGEHFVSSRKEEQMADMSKGHSINPETAAHLAESMDRPPLPTPETLTITAAMGGGRQWPDGNGKRRHPKDRGSSHGRMGHEAAVTAIHRTSRPQLPHSS
jgi:hypothetical protein